MSVDFVARALAQRAGQAQAFTTLATGIPGASIPSSVNVIQTSGYAAHGLGAGTYVADALATAALSTAHPRFCKTDAGGRHWRLLPDDNGLIPVVCGGVNGFAETPLTLSGLASLSGSQGSGTSTANGTVTQGTGNDVVLTATGTNFVLIYRSQRGSTKVRAVVKAGTANRVYLWCNNNPADPDQVNGCWFNLANGTVDADGIGNGTIVSLGGGYYQLDIEATCYQNLGIGISDAPGTNCTPGKTAIVRSLAFAGSDGFDPWSATDDQPGIQAAIEYCEAIDAVGTRYDARHYSRWRKVPAGIPNIHSSRQGLLLATAKSHKFVSSCGQSTLWRRDHDGSPMGIAKFSTLSDNSRWRGGGIFTDGQSSAPAELSDNSITLHDMVLDGGITDSSEQNNPYGAFMNSNGDGWDVTDKGIWQANDRFCGHIVLEGRSAIRYFMGELIYGSGVGPSIARRKIRIGPEVELGHTCGSCLNGNGQTLEVESCLLHNAFIGFEGWTGELGGYFKARITDTNRNSIQGGMPNFGSGSYYLKTRPTASVLPIGMVDMNLLNAGQFDIGSWISGRIHSTDCYVSLGNGTAFAGGSQECDLEVTAICDKGSLVGGIAILGGASGSQATDRITVRLNCKRSDNAIANNYTFAQAVFCYGSYGPNVSVWLDGQDGLNHAPMSPAGTIYDYPIKLTGWDYDANRNPYYYYDIEANNNATIDIKQYGNVIITQCTNNGSYNMNLPNSGVPAGYRLFVRDTTKNFVAGGAACRIPAANLRGGRDLIIPPGYDYAELAFDGGAWSVVTAPPLLTATAAWDPPSIAAGASATTSVGLIGTLVGDEVKAGFSGNLQGLVLTAYVGAAGTVTAVLFNPTGSAVDLASGTLRVTVG